MANFKISYLLQGQMVVQADNESDAKDIIKGVITETKDAITDEALIGGIEGYQDPLSVSNYSIDMDAITVTEVEEVTEKENE
jgi:hypothetical protein